MSHERSDALNWAIREALPVSSGQTEVPLREPPPNPSGGRTLIVDQKDSEAYPRASAALKDSKPDDQVFVRPGLYEDKIFVTERPISASGSSVTNSGPLGFASSLLDEASWSRGGEVWQSGVVTSPQW